MNPLSRLKMKYRLLVVIFLPTLMLLGFLYPFLKGELQTIHKAETVQEVMTLIDKIVRLNQSLQREGMISKNLLANENSNLSKTLVADRQQVDHAIAALQNSADGISDDATKKIMQDTLKPLLTRLDPLMSKRSQIDSKEISANNAFDYFNDQENSAYEAINKLMDLVVNYPITQRLYSLIAVAHEQMANSDATHLILDALYAGKMSRENYNELLTLIGRQSSSREIYYDIAIPVEEEALKQNTQKETWRHVDRIQNSVVAKGLEGPYGTTPDEWLRLQNEKNGIFDNIQTSILEFNKKDIDQLTSEYWRMLLLECGLTLAVLGFVLLVVMMSLRGLALKLEDEVGVLSTSGEEILRSISEASSGMVETATAVTETTTTVEELKQTAQVAAEKAKNVADVSDGALNTLQSSEKTIGDTIQWMTRIHEGMGTISESIVKLSEHSKMIGEIIDAVNDLAEQSHLLAVNAAIEAAKAGDQGKGFAVVAQEVRSLADQSKQATIQVRNILNDIQNATNAAVMATEQGSKAVNHGLSQSAQTNDSIRSLALGINNVAQAASQISLSCQQQLVGVNQVTIAMNNIKTASDQQVDHMRQIEGGVQGMNTVGKSLKEQVVEYKM